MGLEKVTLTWDPPLTGAIGALAPAAYRVYYRLHGVGSWSFLAEVPAGESPSCMVYHKDIGNGSWDFAVRAVTAAGSASLMHTSLDSTADPLSGWYVVWIRTE